MAKVYKKCSYVPFSKLEEIDMLVKLRGNIGDVITYHTGNGDTDTAQIIYVDITVFEDRYDAQYVLKNGVKVPFRNIISIQHRPVKDIEVFDTID